MRKRQSLKDPLVPKKRYIFKEDITSPQPYQQEMISLNVKASKGKQSLANQPYVYPVSIISELLFSWTTNLLRTANRTQLKTIHLGKFHEEYSANTFLKEILPHWEKKSKLVERRKEMGKNKTVMEMKISLETAEESLIKVQQTNGGQL